MTGIAAGGTVAASRYGHMPVLRHAIASVAACYWQCCGMLLAVLRHAHLLLPHALLSVVIARRTPLRRVDRPKRCEGLRYC